MVSVVPEAAVAVASRELRAATEATKCWTCGCLHDSLGALEREFPEVGRFPELRREIAAARAQLRPVQCACRGCEVCYPARALNAVQEGMGERPVGATCPTAPPVERAGWPPLPGAYVALRYNAPVAVCTLADTALLGTLARDPDPALAIVGTLATENLGIERVITNVLPDPHIRFLILCGAESHEAIGHRPGASLLALAHAGVDERGRILGAPGKRPLIRNIAHDAVEHFRRTVEVVDLIGVTQVSTIIEIARAAAARAPGPAHPYAAARVVQPIQGHVPARMVPDPAGYFVIYVDRVRGLLSLEHYSPDGRLDTVIEGQTPGELFTPAIERQLLTRLDHAAYLGGELARAEAALRTGQAYRQDAAPEQFSPAAGGACKCGAACTTS